MYLDDKKIIEAYFQVLNERVDWEDTFPDVKKTCVSPDQIVKELNAELERIGVKSSKRERRSVNSPIVTRGSIEKSMDDEGTIDAMKFKELVTAEPKTIFDRNPKMEKTDDGRPQVTYNTGLPAITAIIWDEENQEFVKVNTCPGAGSCKVVCYARKGFFGMNDGKVLKLIQRINLLLNDPKEYYNRIMDELEPIAFSMKRANRRKDVPEQLVLRWNDSGDFFAQEYYDMARKATMELISQGFDVKSYAYTKIGDFVELSDKDFIMNFSKGALPAEQAKVDMDETKYSDIVPREVFNDIFQRKGAHFIKDEKGKPTFVEGGEVELKQRIADKYNVPFESLKYTDELPIEEGELYEYNVIVLPTGDSDLSAQRNDVKVTFLLVH